MNKNFNIAMRIMAIELLLLFCFKPCNICNGYTCIEYLSQKCGQSGQRDINVCVKITFIYTQVYIARYVANRTICLIQERGLEL